MDLFDEKYVHVLWNDDLKEAKGFVANNIKELIEKVNEKRPDKQFEIRNACGGPRSSVKQESPNSLQVTA